MKYDHDDDIDEYLTYIVYSLLPMYMYYVRLVNRLTAVVCLASIKAPRKHNEILLLRFNNYYYHRIPIIIVIVPRCSDFDVSYIIILINRIISIIFFISVTRVTWYTVTAGSQPAVSSRPLAVCCCLPQYQSSYTSFTGVELRSFRRTCPNRAPCSLGAHCLAPKRNCEWFFKRTAAAAV